MAEKIIKLESNQPDFGGVAVLLEDILKEIKLTNKLVLELIPPIDEHRSVISPKVVPMKVAPAKESVPHSKPRGRPKKSPR